MTGAGDKVRIVDLSPNGPFSSEQTTAAWRAANDVERRDSTRFATPWLRHRWIASRVALRHVIADVAATDPGAVTVTVDAAGRPHVDGADLHVSLTRTANWAGIVVADQPAGIDLERREPLDNARELAARFLHTEDASLVSAATDPEATFYRAWVRLEALLKCRGTGFTAADQPRVLFAGLDLVDQSPKRTLVDLDLSPLPSSARLAGAICFEQPLENGTEAFGDQVFPGLVRVQTIDQVLGIGC